MCPRAPWISALFGIAMAVAANGQPLDGALPSTSEIASEQRSVPPQWMSVTVDPSPGVSVEGVVMVVDLASREMDWRHVELNVLVPGPDGTELSVPLPPTDDNQFAALLDVPAGFDAERVRVRAEGIDQSGRPFEHSASPVIITHVEAQTIPVAPPQQTNATADPTPSVSPVIPAQEGAESRSPWWLALWVAAALVALSILSLLVRRQEGHPEAASDLADSIEEEIEAIASSVEQEMEKSPKPASEDAVEISVETAEHTWMTEERVVASGESEPAPENAAHEPTPTKPDEMLEELLSKIGQASEKQDKSEGKGDGAPGSETGDQASQGDIDSLFEKAKADASGSPTSAQR